MNFLSKLFSSWSATPKAKPTSVPTPETVAPSAPKLLEPPLKGLSILVVEDAPDLLALMSFVLTSEGAVVHLARDGGEGVARMEAHVYDLILMDLQMPILDGYEALRQIRSRGFTRPIIAMTAQGLYSDKEKCLAAGFDNFLLKPIQMPHLIEIILLHVGRR